MQKITPFLWFDGNAKEAVNFYTSVFKNGGKVSAMGAEGNEMGFTFELFGQEYIAFNGGPMFHFTPAISMFLNCDTQDEIDYYWEKLSEGGEKSRCGWLKDKFGLSWQIVPPILGKLLNDPDPVKSQKVMQAMMKMDKLDIKGLQDAYNG